MKKHLIILRHNSGKGGHGRLANQLWNFMSIYAYALERGYDLENYSFFEYHDCFQIPPVRNFPVRCLFFSPFPFLAKKFGQTRAAIFTRKVYKLYVMAVRLRHGKTLLNSYNSPDIAGIFYLPPSEPARPALQKLEDNPRIKNIYFDGWLFRNPAGVMKYHSEILEYFKPKDETRKTIAAFMEPLKTQYDNLVGVHIRQDDYKTFKGGRYFVEQARIREILDEYLREFKKDPEHTCFIITSNGPIKREIFQGLHFEISNLGFIEDLFLLASCTAIIGSDSSFGNFAAYYGNTPHIVFQKEPMDWEYYAGKTKYFWNKYCTLVHF
ncbi:MAG: alpha-1,2-fucosyltransferase [Candidatus Sungbacteria bacterium]|nr:alpha-1,2-fucosyltransferase [Candidatus Sungbacteria bacterium]